MLSALAVVAVGLLALIGGVASAAAAPGTFVQPASSPEDAGAERPNEISSADFDGDGDQDAALADRNGDAVKVMINDGTGNLSLKQSVPAVDFPNGIVAANFDTDTDIDIAVLNRQDNSIQVMINDGSAGFTAKTAVDTGGPVNTQAIAAGDLTGDGVNDLAVFSERVGAAQQGLQIMINDGAGNFSRGVNNDLPGSAEATDVVITPLNGDASADVAVTLGGGDDKVLAFFNDGAGLLSLGGTIEIGREATSIVAAPTGSLDGGASGSGLQARDLAVANGFDSGGAEDVTVSIILNNGSGGFSKPPNSPEVLRNQSSRSSDDLVVGDFAGDGVADDLAITQGAAGVAVLLNNGSADYQEPAGSPFSSEFDSYIGLASADVDGDADDDLYVANDVAGPKDIIVLLNDEDGDGDGVADRDDACPVTSGSQSNGCPPGQAPDADGDGVADADDACPNQSGNGQNGCPPGTGPDSDSDGVPAGDDACPSQSGSGFNGCPAGSGPDSDGDGVAAGDDACPDQPGSGLNGCPSGTGPDSDNDGVPAGDDACPFQAGPQANGCPAGSGPGGSGDILDFDVTAKKKQKQKGKKIKVKASVGAGEKVDVKGKGSIKIKGTKGKVKLKPQSKTVEGGERTVLRLKLKKKKDAKKVKKAIKRYKKASRKKKKKIAVKARIVVNGTAAADGDKAKEKRVVTLK